MKKLEYFRKLQESKSEKTATDSLEDQGIDKDEKKQIEEDSEEHQRIAKENKKLKEENQKD